MDLAAMVAQANLAPSVHNTQPTLWQRDGTGVELHLNTERMLAAGDPTGRDARFSLGAALEGTVIAAAGLGMATKGMEVASDGSGARLDFASGGDPSPDPDARYVAKRMTWRAGFAPVPDTAPAQAYCTARDDTIWVGQLDAVAEIATMNDATSLIFMRDPAFRAELVGWMRLHPRHDRFALDGLSFPALGMSRFEAWAAGKVLRRPVFEGLDAIGLGKSLVSEAAKTRAAAGVVLFHRPRDEASIYSGRAYYRVLLGLARLGLATWPMAALSDDPATNDTLCQRFGIPEDRRLILCLRVGAIPANLRRPARARLPVDDLILL